MSERYTRLFQLAEQEHPIDSKIPVKIMAGALLLDNQQQKVIAQIKFRNTSKKSIKSIVVDISAFDKNGAKVKGVKGFEYTNVIANQEDCFGDKIPVPMEDNNTHSFGVDVISVQFSDGTIWSKSGETAVKVAKTVAKQTAGTTGKVVKVVIPFIVNVIVFLILLLATMGMAISEMESTFDLIATVGFALMTLIAFPSFGLILAKKPNGKKLRLIRWGLVLAILALLFVLGRTVF